MHQGGGIICLIPSTLDILPFFPLAEEHPFVLLFWLHNSSSPSAPNLFVQRSISVLFYGSGTCYCINLDIDFISHYIFCMPEIFHNKDETNKLKKNRKPNWVINFLPFVQVNRTLLWIYAFLLFYQCLNTCLSSELSMLLHLVTIKFLRSSTMKTNINKWNDKTEIDAFRHLPPIRMHVGPVYSQHQ